MRLSLQFFWSTAHFFPFPVPKPGQQVRKQVGTLVKLAILVGLLLAGRQARAQSGVDVFTPSAHQPAATNTGVTPTKGTVANRVLAAPVALPRTSQILSVTH